MKKEEKNNIGQTKPGAGTAAKSNGKPGAPHGSAAKTVGKNPAGGQKTGTVRPEPPLEPLQIGSAIYDTRITRKFRNRKKWARPDERLVLAFIPGTIQKIFVKNGMQVEMGEPLLILEAMKMRNEVLSPVGGVVTRVHVKEGDLVPKNHLLIEFAFH